MHPSVSWRIFHIHTHTQTESCNPTNRSTILCHATSFPLCLVPGQTSELYQSMQDRPSVAPHQTTLFKQTTSPAHPAAGLPVVYMPSCVRKGREHEVQGEDERKTERVRHGDGCDLHDGHGEWEWIRIRLPGREGSEANLCTKTSKASWEPQETPATPLPLISAASSDLIGYCN